MVARADCFTKLHFLGNLTDATQLERRVDYQPGRLRKGCRK